MITSLDLISTVLPTPLPYSSFLLVITTHRMLVPFSILVVVCRNALLGMSQTIGGFVPDMVPLGIRSPYFNAWVQSSGPSGHWPTFWNDQVGVFLTSLLLRQFDLCKQILGWSGFVRIDGTVWKWLGGSFVPTSNTSLVTHLEITPTRTTYQLNAGPMDLTITYLTPIEVSNLVRYGHTSLTSMKPADPVKQSFPFTYISLEASSTDGKSHSVQVYSDISAGAQLFYLSSEADLENPP